MTLQELQDFMHIYCMFSFSDGSREPGMLVSKYNVSSAEVEYYFIHQVDMHLYKNAHEKFDREGCARLSKRVTNSDIRSIRPVSLTDYKMIMQLLQERKIQLNIKR